MTDFSLHQFLIIYTWFPLVAMLSLMLLIARFYQKFSNVRMFFRFYTLPMILFGIAAVRYSSVRQIAGDNLADVLLGIAGVILIFLSLRLYHQMIIQPPQNPPGDDMP